MIDKTFDFIFKHSNYRTLGCGRTDAKVSADDYALELFVSEKQNTEKLLHQLNCNLPSDIRAKSIEEVNSEFNIIQDAKIKEYHYYFSSGLKSHPFNAPFIRDFGKQLNMDAMIEAAKCFRGFYNFKRYCSKPSEDTIFEREIISSEIVSQEKFDGRFTAENSFVFKVRGKGFMRYQIRLMMGALVEVGRGVWSIEDLKNSLVETDKENIKHVAPSSGLVLHKVEFI